MCYNRGMIRTGKKFSKPAMSRVINGDVTLPTEAQAPEKVRLDILLTQKYKSYNRSTLQKFIEKGFVTVDGELARKANQKFLPEVKLDLRVPEELKNSDLVPEVIYEDDQVLALNKPAGLLSMAKGEYCPEKTLEDWGLLVHRLDRDTSGVVILAKDAETQKFLRKQFQDRKAHKTYYAVVAGRPKLDAARIDLPIARDIKHKTRFRVEAGGRASETYYRVIEKSETLSLLELKPTTGRTHQLRVHLNYIGHPIIGDVVYGQPALEYGVAPERLYLHAGALELTLPGGVRKTFSAPIPAEFLRIFNGSPVTGVKSELDYALSSDENVADFGAREGQK